MRLFLAAVFVVAVDALAQAASQPALTLNIPFAKSAKKIDITLEPTSLKDEVLSNIPLNQMFKLRVVCKSCDASDRKDLKLENFDAIMPAHRHGMVTKSKVTRRADDSFLIEGVKFHMPGIWEMRFRWSLKTEEAQVAMPLNL